jgi:hypothetical protein
LWSLVELVVLIIMVVVVEQVDLEQEGKRL